MKRKQPRLEFELGSPWPFPTIVTIIQEASSLGYILPLALVKQPYIHTYIRGSLKKFPDFFVWALLLIVYTWNSSPRRSTLLLLQCTCSTVPTTSGRLHGSPLVWSCPWPSSQPLSSPPLSHNNSLWALGISKNYREQGMDYREAEELSWCPSWSYSLWQG